MAKSNQMHDPTDFSLDNSFANPIKSGDAVKHEFTSDPWKGSMIMHVKRQSSNRDYICSCLDKLHGRATSNHSTKQNIIKVETAELNMLKAPDDDQFIFCQDCNLEHLGDCPIHGGLIITKDKQAPADGSDPYRAQNTLPSFLTIKESSIPKAGRGVFSTKVIPKGTRFGPYEGVRIDGKDSNSRYSWKIHKDDGQSHYIDAFDQSLSNWMRFVNCPCQEEQQNLIAFQYKGEIYYRTVVEIPQNTELLVWYGDQHGGNCVPNNPHLITGENELDTGIQQNNLTTQPSKSKVQRSGDLLKHQKKHTGEQPHKCSVCGKALRTSWDLRLHQRIHTGEKPYKCSVCSKKFNYASDFRRHQRTHTGEKPYICSVCDKGFAESSHLRRHQLTHSGEKPSVPCVVRGSQTLVIFTFTREPTQERNHTSVVCVVKHTGGLGIFVNIREYTQERNVTSVVCVVKDSIILVIFWNTRENTQEKPYTCSVCGKGFGSSGVLHTHERIHIGKKPYICHVCGKGFTFSGDLRKHQRVHTGEKPFSCSVCGVRFTVSSSLRTHARTHTGEKPYICSMCGKGFRRSGDLRTHKRIHTGEKPYICSLCGKGFNQSGWLHKHKRAHTEESK